MEQDNVFISGEDLWGRKMGNFATQELFELFTTKDTVKDEKC